MAVVGNMRDLYKLNCDVCKESYKNPKVLPCLHSYCRSCLEDIVSVSERILVCPTCQIDIQLPTKGVDAFQPNSVVNNMLNILAVQNPTKCTNCDDEEPATSRCLDCVENLCLNCVTAHERIRQTKSHTIISFEELQNNALLDTIKCPSFCAAHEREALKYFCESCDDVICRECAIYDHREHNYLDLKEAVKLHRGILSDLVDRTKRKMPILQMALNEILDIGKNLAQRKENIVEMINSTIDTYQKELENKRKSLLDKLQVLCIDKEATLKEQSVSLSMDLQNLLTSTEFVDHMMHYGNEAEIMTAKCLMVNRLYEVNNSNSQVEPEENDVIEFLPQDEMLEKAIENFGKIYTSSAFAPNCILEGEGAYNAKIGQTATFQIIAKDKFEKRVTKGGDIFVAKLSDSLGFTTMGDVLDISDGSYTISYTVHVKEKHKLSVYLREKPIKGSPFEISISAGIDKAKIGPLLTQFGGDGVLSKTDESYEPWGITYNELGNIIVTDHNNHRVQVFDANGKFLCTFGARGKENGDMWYPTGVAIDKNFNIFVADHGNHRIQVFTKNGTFLRQIGKRGSGEGELKGPCGIAIDRQQRVIVTDRDNHRVQVFESNGKFLFAFGGSGSSDGKFNSPRHIAVTDNCNILVSDTNNYKVQVFDKHGQFLYKFGSKGSQHGQFLCPSGIGVDIENNIAVADYKNVNVQFFTEKGEFIKYLGNNELKSSRQFVKPTGVCITPLGNVLVADRGTHKVHLY